MVIFSKTSIFYLIIVFFFTGCYKEVNVNTLNKSIFMEGLRTVNTYNRSESKITSYYFSNRDGKLFVSNEITYIPIDVTDQLYNPFLQVKITLNRLTHGRAETIEEALEMEVDKQGNKKLYIYKDEYIIGNDFARDLKWSIRDFNDMIERQEDREKLLILPQD